MRILRVAPWLYPDTKGGGQYHVHAMSRDQAAMGHDVTVLTIRQDRSLPHTEEREGYSVVRFDSIASPLGNDISTGLARYLKSAQDFDIIHAHSHYYMSTIVVALKRRLGDTPLAITNHGLYSQSAPEWLFRWYLKSLGRWTFNQADVVFCYTETDRERVRELGVSSRIEVVPNGIDTERFSPDGPGSELIDAEGPVVLFVGRFTEGKRPWLAVEAFDSVLEVYPGAELCLCGDGPLREELINQVRELRIGESVTFLGHVPYNEMPKVYRSGDVLVLPSQAEGVPRAILEARASGLPVVTSDLPQIGEVLSNGSWTVDVDTGPNLREVLVEAVAWEEETVLESCRWEETVRKTTRVLEGLITFC